MESIFRILVLTTLAHAGFSAPLSPEQSVTFFGEDFHIHLPVGAPDVVFQRTAGTGGGEVVLMKAGETQGPRAKLNQQLSHLILENVGESDEGIYTVTSQDPEDNSTISKSYLLIVRDCSNEHNVKFGENFHIQVAGVSTPISVEFRPIDVEANQTSRPALILLKNGAEYQEGYDSRLSVSENRVTLSSVTGADEGSYTILDSIGKVQKKVCLKVKVHQTFPDVPYGGTLKFNLILNSSQVRLNFSPSSDSGKSWMIMQKGELTIPEDVDMQDRLSVDGFLVTLEKVKSTDAGVFLVTDLDGFPIAKTHLKVEAFKLPALYITIIALIGLVVLLLLVCLLACILKIRKRAEKSRAIEKIAKNAGQEEGDAFRQVVKDACKQAEDTNVTSLKEDNTEKSQSTEVSIKGLEVSSKEVTAFDKNLETSDSGVGFNTTALPLDSDTEAPSVAIQDSDVLSTSAATEAKPAPTLTPEPKPAPPPTPEPKASPPPQPKPAPPPTPEPKASPPPEPKPAASPTPVSKPASSPTPVSKPASSPTPVSKPASSPTPELKPASSPTPVSKPASSPTPELKPASSPTPVSKPAASPTPDTKLAPTPEPKSPVPKSPTPETKPVSTPPPEPKVTLTPPPEPKPAVSPTLPKSPIPEAKSSPTTAKPVDEKPAPPSPVPELKAPPSPSPDQKPVTPEPKPPASPEPKAALAPTPEAKPAVSPTLEPKAPTPDPKPASSPTPDPKPAVSPAVESKPTTNGTPEPKADSGSPAPGLELLGSESPKIAPPKSPEPGLVKAPPPVDVSSDGGAAPVTNDTAPSAAEETTTT